MTKIVSKVIIPLITVYYCYLKMFTNNPVSNFQTTIQSKNLCRICLNKSDQMLALHEELGPHTSISVLTALQSVMAVKLNESKAYPQLICSICISSLRIAYDLKQQYHESDKRITSLLNKAMEELPAIIKVENERVTSGDTVVELTEGQTKYLDSNIVFKGEISDFPYNLGNHVSIESACEEYLNIKQELEENIEIPDYVSAEDISTLSHDIKTETEECDLSQIKMETEESNSTSTSSEQTKHVTNNTLEDVLTGGKAHACQYCPYTTGRASHLKRHMVIHTGEKAHACQYCPYKTTSTWNLTKHTLTHTGEKPHACQYCPYKTARSDCLKTHMLTHTGENAHSCQYCPYTTRITSHLKRHMLRHTGEKPHACQYCPYKASEASNLTKHMLTHTGEKAHACQYCPYKTARTDSLKTHMLIHTGEKPHTCQYCPYTTAYLNALKEHMVSHTGEMPHACQYCPYKTSRATNLKIHMLTHTGEKPYACQYCPYTTGLTSNLNRHMLTQH